MSEDKEREEKRVLITLEGEILNDRYRLDKLLAEGGIGAVYIGTHLLLDKKVAIKVLRPSFFSMESYRKRFFREAKVLSRLNHVNIVAISDFGISDSNIPYLVMELLTGKSLEEEMGDGKPFPLTRALHITKQILAALSYAHAQSIVHRDLKPSNIYLIKQPGVEDLVKILDFGLAKFVSPDGGSGTETLTQQGTVFGTPAYMSPEQASGSPLDHRTDIYSTGIILYEMVTGRRPFIADSQLELIRMHLFTPPLPPSEVNPELDLPYEIDKIILKALEKLPDKRYQSAEEFLNDIHKAEELYFEGESSLPKATGNIIKKEEEVNSIINKVDTPEMAKTIPAIINSEVVVKEKKAVLPLRKLGLVVLLILTAIIIIFLGVVLTVSFKTSKRLGESKNLKQQSTGQFQKIEKQSSVKSNENEKMNKLPPPRDPFIEPLPVGLQKLKKALEAPKWNYQTHKFRQKMTSIFKDDPRVYLIIGNAFAEKKWYSDALNFYEKGLKLDPSVRGEPTLKKMLKAMCESSKENISNRAQKLIEEYKIEF